MAVLPLQQFKCLQWAEFITWYMYLVVQAIVHMLDSQAQIPLLQHGMVTPFNVTTVELLYRWQIGVFQFHTLVLSLVGDH